MRYQKSWLALGILGIFLTIFPSLSLCAAQTAFSIRPDYGILTPYTSPSHTCHGSDFDTMSCSWSGHGIGFSRTVGGPLDSYWGQDTESPPDSSTETKVEEPSEPSTEQSTEAPSDSSMETDTETPATSSTKDDSHSASSSSREDSVTGTSHPASPVSNVEKPSSGTETGQPSSVKVISKKTKDNPSDKKPSKHSPKKATGKTAKAPGATIPKNHGMARSANKNNTQHQGKFVYFNQTDSQWNQNNLHIASSGCGPTSMAVVISSLTKRWFTPVDAAAWGQRHGYYSPSGSAHAMIPAMAKAYGLKCKGVGTSYHSVKKALKQGKPVVALMGPGHFTRKGHFIVLTGIDENDGVTVADVGSRRRSSCKYSLSYLIGQSKAADAGGPFWVISRGHKKKPSTKTKENPSSYVIFKTSGDTISRLEFQLGDIVSYHGISGIIVSLSHRKARVLGAGGSQLTDLNHQKAIPLSRLKKKKAALSCWSAPFRTAYRDSASFVVSYLCSRGESPHNL